MKSDWKWFGSAGHLIVGQWCRFHLCTQVGDYYVSTVGEYWPERVVREIHAKVHDPNWLVTNGHRRGDDFDAAYMNKFGFESIGIDGDIYETMVFRAGEPCAIPDCDCGLPSPNDWSDLLCRRFKTRGQATRGHMEICELADSGKIEARE
jgi:hypothetical protein